MEFDAFTSDPHYYHKKIIEYCSRPFSSAQEMNETLIQNYNDVVGKNDRVLWLGDTLMGGTKEGKSILDRLNGKKYLCLGNHDLAPHKMCAMGFELATDRMYFHMAGRKIVANHYDAWNYRSIWDDRYESRRYKVDPASREVLFHGHTHQKSKSLLFQVHLGVDAWDYKPARREEVENVIKWEIPDSFESKEFRNSEACFAEYKSLLSKKKNSTLDVDKERIDNLIKDSKFNWLRGLGWEKETRNREK